MSKILYFCVSSNVLRGTEHHKLLGTLLKESRYYCDLIYMCDDDSLIKRMKSIDKSEFFFIPAGLELTDQIKEDIDAAIRMAKTVRFFSHGKLKDNEETIKFMQENKIAERPFLGNGDMFFSDEVNDYEDEEDFPIL